MPATFRLTVTGASSQSLLSKLEDAERIAVRQAINLRTGGVLVTRHDMGRYTVELDDTVPFGTTQERDLWSAS